MLNCGIGTDGPAGALWACATAGITQRHVMVTALTIKKAWCLDHKRLKKAFIGTLRLRLAQLFEEAGDGLGLRSEQIPLFLQPRLDLFGGNFAQVRDVAAAAAD